MNHQKVYESIIYRAKSQNRIKLRKSNPVYIYYENHHIIPRCLNGGEEKENKVLLTAREHFICHKLLTYIYPNNQKIVYAFFRITFSKRLGCKISSKDYAYAKELKASFHLTKETKNKISIKTTGKIVSDITCKNISKSKKDKHFHHSEKTIVKIKKSLTGRKDSEETLNRKRKPHKKFSEETVQKMKKPKSEQARKNMSLAQKKRREFPFSN
jgi:hypothetical protein